MTMHMTTIGGTALALCLCAVGAGCDSTAKADNRNAPTTIAAPATPAPAPAATPAPAPAAITKPMTPLRFSFATDMAKVGGKQEGGALICKKDSCKSGIVAYGPYTKAVAEGQRIATFQVGGVGVSGLDKEAATFDVYDSVSNQRLALRSVKGKELPDNQQQNIEVAFTAPAKSNLEFRVGWHGEGELKLYNVEIH